MTRASGPSRSIAYGCCPPAIERQHAFGGVLADPEAEPSAVRRAGEVCPFDSELVEDGNGVHRL